MTRTDTAWCIGQTVRARGPRWDAIGTPLWYRMVQVWGSVEECGGYGAGVGGSEIGEGESREMAQPLVKPYMGCAGI